MNIDAFGTDSNNIKDSLLLQSIKLTDIIDEKKRESNDHTAYFGYLKDFLINSGCLCDDNLRAAFNDAVLLSMIGARVLLEDTINAYYLKSRQDTARMSVAADWFKISNDPNAYKNKLDGKSVAQRASEANDEVIKTLHDGEYADFCNYTHSTAHRAILNSAQHRSLASKKTTIVSIKAYANIVICIAEIVGEPMPRKLIEEVKTYFEKYRKNVMEASLDVT